MDSETTAEQSRTSNGTWFHTVKRLAPSPVRSLAQRTLGVVWRIIHAQMHEEPQAVRAAYRNLRREMETALTTQRSSPIIESLRGRTGLRLHLGCGADIKPGWVNIDLSPSVPLEAAEATPIDDTLVLCYDLRLGLPFDEGSSAYVYTSHFLEHLDYRDGVSLLSDCHRVLGKGGTFRAAMPTFRDAFGAYLRNDMGYFEHNDAVELLTDLAPGTKTLVDCLNYAVYQNGEHKCIYDEEKLLLLLRGLGFASVSLSSYQPGVDPSSGTRRRHSWYVEAVK